MMATAETPACCFTAIFGLSVENSALITGTQVRIESIIAASRVRGDGFHEQLEASLHDCSSTQSVYFHKNCVSTYTPDTHTAKCFKSTANRPHLNSPKERR